MGQRGIIIAPPYLRARGPAVNNMPFVATLVLSAQGWLEESIRISGAEHRDTEQCMAVKAMSKPKAMEQLVLNQYIAEILPS